MKKTAIIIFIKNPDLGRVKKRLAKTLGDEKALDIYKEKHNEYMDFMKWYCRPDGHGGSKGGTREEYEYYLERVKRWEERKKEEML